MARPLSPALATTEGRSRRMAALLDELKAEEVCILDVRGLCNFTDAYVVATARSSTHLQACMDKLKETLRNEGLRPINSEERGVGRWSLLDYGDVLVHLLEREARAYYNLEGLWSDAVRLDWQPVAPSA